MEAVTVAFNCQPPTLLALDDEVDPVTTAGHLRLNAEATLDEFVEHLDLEARLAPLAQSLDELDVLSERLLEVADDLTVEGVLSELCLGDRAEKVHAVSSARQRYVEALKQVSSSRSGPVTLLNRGESMHQLQRAVYSGKVAPERGRRRDEMKAISGSHALLTNIVLAWNAARMHEAVERLRRGGIAVEDDWLRRMGPAHFSHINFRGTMRFGVEKFAAALIQRAPGQAARLAS